jgi:hypothetical protein
MGYEMKILIAQFAFLFLFSDAAFAEIYKCVEKNRVTYSNSPCPVGASGTLLELSDSGKKGIANAETPGFPAKPVSTGVPPMQGVPSAVPPETLGALKKSLELLNSGGPSSGQPSGDSPGMMDAVKKQIELLIRQRDPNNNTAEWAGRKIEGD